MTGHLDNRDVVIVSAVRTPVGKFMGKVGGKSAVELAGLAIAEAISQSGIEASSIYEVIIGHVVAAGTGQAPARQAARAGGLPEGVGAFSVNKVCGSGLKAVMLAANAIKAGEAEAYVVGGMENMSQAPYILPTLRRGMRFGHGEVRDALLYDGLWCSFQEWAMGNAAEFIAQQFEVTREEMDAYALRSHERAAAATVAGHFKNEIVPVPLAGSGDSAAVTIDEPIRARFMNGHYEMTTSLEKLANLPPVFAEDGLVTAGNAPGLYDGAAALVVMSDVEARRQALTPLARVVGYAHVALDPQWIFAAPAHAIPRLLGQTGWKMTDVDLIELNEAFAAQVLANGVELRQRGHEWDWDKVNVNGGAIALGHPLGASGARILVTLLHALRHRDLRRGIAALCLGGGEAVALAVER